MVVAALSQRRPALALGNVLGSTISNILGAFSLGLLAQTGPVAYDASAKAYAAVLLAVTTAASALAALRLLDRLVGVILVVTFVLYVASVCWGIYKGVFLAPQDSDDESSDSASDDDDDSDVEDGTAVIQPQAQPSGR